MIRSRHRTADPKGKHVNPLDHFVMLAKLSTSAAAAEIIKQVLDAPGVYVFSELMDVPSIKDLNGTEFTPYYDLLTVFAYGTYKADYINNGRGLPELTVAQKKKLQQLTIISLAEQDRCIPYKTLLDELGIGKLRELEDLIIEAIYAEIIQGQFDHERALLEVETTIGRDARRENLPKIRSALESWCDRIANLQIRIDALKESSTKSHLDSDKKKLPKTKLTQQMDSKLFPKSYVTAQGTSTRDFAQRRLLADIQEMDHACPPGVTVVPKDDDIFQWAITVADPDADPVSGGRIFEGIMIFFFNYPYVPPFVTITSKVSHPNISESGVLCLEELDKYWTPCYSVWSFLASVQYLLIDPA